MTKNPFDFNDLSDLPEELQKRLNTETADNARVYADVVAKGAEAGFPELDINQIIAAATRMDLEPPTQQTVRNYLNAAVKLGLISKPTRMTYGPATEDGAAEPVVEEAPKAKKGAKAETVVSDDAVATAEVDPLAGL